MRRTSVGRSSSPLGLCIPTIAPKAPEGPMWIRDDAATKRCLAQLLINLSDNVNDPQNVGGGM